MTWLRTVAGRLNMYYPYWFCYDLQIGQEKKAMETKNAVTRMVELKDQQIAEMLEHERRKKSPYTKWIQVNNSIEAYKVEDWLMKNSPTAYRIFRFLASNMDKYNAVICSYKVMQEKFGYGQATVARAVELLNFSKNITMST